MSGQPSGEPGLHTYMVQQWTMRPGWPLRFSDGERVVAVLASEQVPGPDTGLKVTMLVELPAGWQADGAGKDST